MNGLVSAIITTYGRKFDFILRSIKSVKNQTYKNIEIVLVDDNNPESVFRQDIELNICRYPQINYVKLEKNSGAQVARNTGIIVAHGEYLAFLDDDDEWMPEKIEKQMRVLDENVGLVFSKGYIQYENSNLRIDYVTTSNFKSVLQFKDLLYADYIGTTTQALIPKYVFEKIGYFDEKQVARQDYEMWLRISKEYTCIGVDEPLYVHYMHEGEQISKNKEKAISGIENISKKYRNEYKKHPFAGAHIYMILGHLYKKVSIKQFVKYKVLFLFYFVAAVFTEPKEIIRLVKEHNAKS